MENSNGEDLHAFFNANTSLSQPVLFGQRVAMKWTKDICIIIHHGNFCQKLVHDTCDLHMPDCAYLRREHSTLSEQRRSAAATP
jgi:hypothetical protein